MVHKGIYIKGIRLGALCFSLDSLQCKIMCAIKGIQHPFLGRWFSAQPVFECWGFRHKRHPFWGPLDIHKMVHPTAITCKIDHQ